MQILIENNIKMMLTLQASCPDYPTEGEQLAQDLNDQINQVK